MNLLEETEKILNAHKIHPRKRLGQNFLVEREFLEKMISYASLTRDDTVLEVGAGLGFLTELLAESTGHVIAVEIDQQLIKILVNRLRKYRNVTILKGDVLRMNVPAFSKVVSTPPYSISSPLLFWLLKKNFERAVLTFQEEFAKRLAAQTDTKDYGRITVATYYRADVDLLDHIPKEAFWPAPEVDSMIVRLKPKKPPFHVENEEEFFNFIRVVFTQKNKKLRNAAAVFLSQFKMPKRELYKISDSLPFSYRRIRELMPEELGLAFNELTEMLREMSSF